MGFGFGDLWLRLRELGSGGRCLGVWVPGLQGSSFLGSRSTF